MTLWHKVPRTRLRSTTDVPISLSRRKQAPRCKRVRIGITKWKRAIWAFPARLGSGARARVPAGACHARPDTGASVQRGSRTDLPPWSGSRVPAVPPGRSPARAPRASGSPCRRGGPHVAAPPRPPRPDRAPAVVFATAGTRGHPEFHVRATQTTKRPTETWLLPHRDRKVPTVTPEQRPRRAGLGPGPVPVTFAWAAQRGESRRVTPAFRRALAGSLRCTRAVSCRQHARLLGGRHLPLSLPGELAWAVPRGPGAGTQVSPVTEPLLLSKHQVASLVSLGWGG